MTNRKSIAEFEKDLESNDLSQLKQIKKEVNDVIKDIRNEWIKIQLKYKKFDAGSFWEKDNNKWHEYFPHESTTKDHENTWCTCIYCKEIHDLYFKYLDVIINVGEKIFKIAKKDPANLLFDSRGQGSDWVDCMICGKSGLNHNIAAFVHSKEEGQQIVQWFSKYHKQYLDYRPSEPRRIQVKIGLCDEHKDFFDLIGEFVQYSYVNKQSIDQAFETYFTKHKKEGK